MLKNDIRILKNEIKSLLRLPIRYFLQGLLYVGPVFAILSVIYWIFLKIDNLLPFKFPGLGFLVIIVGLCVIGYLGNTIIARPLIGYLRRTIDKMPLLKTIYQSIKELLSAFVGNKKKFNVPVMVKMNIDADIYKLGFLTKEDLSALGFDKKYVAVYLPHSYNFSGNMFVVPATHVTPINMPSADVMKFIVSGGIINISEEENEENETDKN